MSATFQLVTKLMVLSLCFSQLEAQDSRFVVFGGGKHGYINQAGTLAIPIELEVTYVLDFSDGLAPFAEGVKPPPTRYPFVDQNGKVRVSREEKWGFINTAGSVHITPQFDAVKGFSEGLAGVAFDTDRTSHNCYHCDANQKWGFIDKSGEPIIKAQFHSVGPFSEGLAAVENSDRKWGYINATGDVVIPFTFAVARSFHEGLAVAAIGEKAGYIDHQGNFAVEPQFTLAGDFSDGLAAVRTGGRTGAIVPVPGGGRWSFIGRDGTTRIVLPKSVESAEDFAEGRASVQVKGRCGYITPSGAVVIPIVFSRCGAFSEGFADVFKDGKPKYIDGAGKIAIDPPYDGIHPFKHGLAAVQVGTGGPNQKFGYIDKRGNEVWKPRSAL